MTRRRILSAIGGLAILLAAFLLYRVFRNQDPEALWHAVTSVSAYTLTLALLFTAGSFLAIAVLEYLALQHVHADVSMRRIGATTLAAVGIGHTVGLSALSSGAVRYRMYSRAGLNALDVGKILIFCGLSTTCGLAGVGGVALISQAHQLAPILHLSTETIRLVGVICWIVLLGYLAACFLSPARVVSLGSKVAIRLPTGRMALCQALSANTNVLCIAGALYTCMHEFTEASYPLSAALYVSSDLAALLGHVPGGWGVLEYIVSTTLDGSEVLAGVVLYRTIYFLVPLLVGLAVFITDEIFAYRRQEEISPSHPVTNAT